MICPPECSPQRYGPTHFGASVMRMAGVTVAGSAIPAGSDRSVATRPHTSRTNRQEPARRLPGRTPSMSSRDGRTARLLLTVEEAADQLGIGRTLMYALLKDGKVEPAQTGRLRPTPSDPLPRYLERLRTAPFQSHNAAA